MPAPSPERIQLAALTDEGVKQFKLVLAKAPSMDLKAVQESLARIASSPKLSRPVGRPTMVDMFPTLTTRGDTATWAKRLLLESGIHAGPGTGTEGVFSWLALAALPSLCKRNRSGRLSVKDLERYIQTKEARGFYRHLVSGPYWFEARHGMRSRLFLCQAAHEMPEVQEQIVSRPWLRESGAVIELADRLYWDEKAGRPKDGFTATDRGLPPEPGMAKTRPRAGTLRAFEALLGQLQCTHDLQTMSADQLQKRLPAEFGPWLQRRD